MNSPGNPVQLVSTLIRNISDVITNYNRIDADAFNSTYLEAVTSNITLRDVEQGFSLQTQLNSLTTAMQVISNNTEHDQLREMLWNPITAAIINAIHSTLIIDDKQRGVRKEVTTDLNKAKPGKIAKPGTDKTRSTINQLPKPAPIDKPASLDTDCPQDIETQVRFDIASKKSKTFHNLRHVKCTKIDCKFCLDFAKALPLTKCIELKCHRANTLCHPSGWYVHALPVPWHNIVKEHDKGKEFSPTMLRPTDLAQVKNREPQSGPSITKTTSGTQSVKRARTLSLDDDSSRQSLSSLMDHSASWADECDDASRDVIRVDLNNAN